MAYETQLDETQLDEATGESGHVLTVTGRAIEKVLEIRGGEDDPEAVGLRVAITGVYGVDFTYDLAFDPVADVAPDDDVTVQSGLTVIVPADSIDRLRGATLDLPALDGQGGLVIRNPNRPNPLEDLDLELEGDVATKVGVLLEKSINPSLAAHGGYATLLGVDDEQDVYITMGGGCQGCAMSRATLTNGIRAAIKDTIPEVRDVIDATDHTAGENPFYS